MTSTGYSTRYTILYFLTILLLDRMNGPSCTARRDPDGDRTRDLSNIRFLIACSSRLTYWLLESSLGRSPEYSTLSGGIEDTSIVFSTVQNGRVDMINLT